jgi:hypothetical protein
MKARGGSGIIEKNRSRRRVEKSKERRSVEYIVVAYKVAIQKGRHIMRRYSLCRQ